MNQAPNEPQLTFADTLDRVRRTLAAMREERSRSMQALNLALGDQWYASNAAVWPERLDSIQRTPAAMREEREDSIQRTQADMREEREDSIQRTQADMREEREDSIQRTLAAMREERSRSMQALNLEHGDRRLASTAAVWPERLDSIQRTLAAVREERSRSMQALNLALGDQWLASNAAVWPERAGTAQQPQGSTGFALHVETQLTPRYERDDYEEVVISGMAWQLTHPEGTDHVVTAAGTAGMATTTIHIIIG